MRSLLAVALVACTSSSAPSPGDVMCGSGTTLSGNECVAPALACGSGTHEDADTCVADPIVPGYRVRAFSRIPADGKTPVTIAAFGTNSDGSFATDAIVFNTDRAGAGTFEAPAATLDARGAKAAFVPCDAAVAGCVGTVSFTIALASAPTTPIAHITSELVAPPLIGSIEQCTGTANVLYMEGAGFVYTGKLTVTDATFGITGADERAQITVQPSEPLQGPTTTLLFDTVQLGAALAPGVFQNAIQSPAGPGAAQFSIASSSPYASCDFSTAGEFQIFDYQPAQSITVSFRDWCTPTMVVSGCLHVQ